MATDTERLVDDYLRRLQTAAATLPAPERAELVSDIRQHIGAALADVDTADEVSTRNVLERLGPPEEIVAAVDDSGESVPARPAVHGSSRVLSTLLGAVFVLAVVPLVLVTLMGAGNGLGAIEIGILLVLIAGLGYAARAAWRRSRQHV